MLLKEIDALSREKFLEKEALLSIFEMAFSKVYAKHYGIRNDIRASIHPKTGEINLKRHRLITDEITCTFKQIIKTFL